jgi:hypothetical protein
MNISVEEGGGEEEDEEGEERVSGVQRGRRRFVVSPWYNARELHCVAQYPSRRYVHRPGLQNSRTNGKATIGPATYSPTNVDNVGGESIFVCRVM